MRWKTILVPYDFSASADHALAIALPLARLHAGAIVLAHVIELSPHFGPETTLFLADDSPTPVGIHHHARSCAEADLRALIAAHAGDVALTSVVREGVPAAEIVELVDALPADLVVMGTHGRTGWRRVVTGSVAERVVRLSPVPVLTVRHPE